MKGLVSNDYIDNHLRDILIISYKYLHNLMEIVNEETTSFDQAIEAELQKKHKNVKWEKLPKFNQWKLFKAYMHENKITDGNLFKKMKSLISEKRTDAFVTYDVLLQKVTHIDFKHEHFIRERSKKKKIHVQMESQSQQKLIEELESKIQGLDVENLEVLSEIEIHVNDV